MNFKRITLLCGHYGSGKTNVAVNFAYELKKLHERTAIADLDIVNPYFRTKDSAAELAEHGIELICSDYAGSNVDIPALPQQMYKTTDDRSGHFIIDVGGDDRGALALGRIAPEIIKENNYEMLMVINCYRPLTRTAEATLEIMREIEFAGGIKFTGLVNNSNLGEETSVRDVLASLDYATEVSRLSGLPITATTVEHGLFGELGGRIDNLYSLRLQPKP